MKTTTLTINNVDYTLATTLRVAYVLQGYNNHKPYLDIFQEIDKMPLEKQIEFLYAAYTVANGDQNMSKGDFLNECLDNLNLGEIMDAIKMIIEGITGKKIEDIQAENAEAEVPEKEGKGKN